jgi:hypothetical protein
MRYSHHRARSRTKPYRSKVRPEARLDRPIPKPADPARACLICQRPLSGQATLPLCEGHAWLYRTTRDPDESVPAWLARRAYARQSRTLTARARALPWAWLACCPPVYTRVRPALQRLVKRYPIVRWARTIARAIAQLPWTFGLYR